MDTIGRIRKITEVLDQLSAFVEEETGKTTSILEKNERRDIALRLLETNDNLIMVKAFGLILQEIDATLSKDLERLRTAARAHNSDNPQ